MVIRQWHKWDLPSWVCLDRASNSSVWICVQSLCIRWVWGVVSLHIYQTLNINAATPRWTDPYWVQGVCILKSNHYTTRSNVRLRWVGWGTHCARSTDGTYHVLGLREFAQTSGLCLLGKFVYACREAKEKWSSLWLKWDKWRYCGLIRYGESARRLNKQICIWRVGLCLPGCAHTSLC